MKQTKIYRTGEFAEMLHVSVSTLQKWDRTGVLPAFRSATNRRFYTEDQYQAYMALHCPQGVSGVSGSNQRPSHWKKSGPKSNRPDADTLRELYKDHTAYAIGQMYGVTESAVRVWLWNDRKQQNACLSV